MNDRPGASENDALRRALSALESMRTRITAMQSAAREPIAVVGLGCRFPGVEGPAEFARFLENAGDAIIDLPRDRPGAEHWNESAVLRKGGFFADVAGFDPGFFDMSDAQALATDPHQRLMLEVAWEALEDAGAAGGSLAGTRTGVYLGLGAQNSDYAYWLLNDARKLDAHGIAGSFHSLMPGRLSYLLDLRGPSLVIDAACASGLVAVHHACQALRHKEIDAALAGAVNLILSPLVSQAVNKSGLLSKSGRCHSFDARADGFVRGEGASMLVLKRYSDAIADGDSIRALIHGGAVGQDGHSNGLTAPNGPAQEAIVRLALSESGLTPSDIGYVETHATGTSLGDAIEAQALAVVYAQNRTHALLIGAVKPNLGHLEAASGIAGLAKTILALQRRVIPPTLGAREINPEINEEDLNVRLVTAASPWPEQAPYAGVSAFGMSGTNAHIIVGPAPARPTTERQVAEPGSGERVLMLSAPTEDALRLLSKRIADALSDEISWHDVCATLNTGRKVFPTRLIIEARNIGDAREQLFAYADGGDAVTLQSELARRAAAGDDIDWVEEQGRAQSRPHLPTSPYIRRRFWPDGIALNTSSSTDPAQLLHQLQWRPAPAEPAQQAQLATQPKRLLLSGDPCIARELQSALENAGFETTLAPAIDATRRDAAAWRPILATAPGATVIYCAGGAIAPDSESLRVEQEATLAPLLHLIQALADSEEHRLVLLGVGAWEGATSAAMVLALGRGIALEHPELACRRIEMSHGLSEPGVALAAELATADGEEWVRLTPNGRLAARLSKLRAAPNKFIARKDAAYLITGGLGGIGRLLAGWLIDRGARNLLLVGRGARELPEREAWQARGATIRVALADVADPLALGDVLSSLDSEGIALAGVFHVAGLTADELLYRQSWDDFARVLPAKAEGAAVLHELTRDRTLDLFVLFSSITSLCGLAGNAAYATANASLGAMARARRAQGLPALNVYWGTWRDSGMAESAHADLAAQWEEHGIHSFPSCAALAALETLLGGEQTEAVVASADWSRLAHWAKQEGSGSELYAEFLDQAPASPPPARKPASSHDLDSVVRDILAGLLRLSPTDPALDRPFGELGLDSLAAIELRNRLAESLGIPIPATLAFNHPSRKAVVSFLSKRLNKREKHEQPATLAKEIEQLTEAEAEQRLAAVLNNLK